MPKYLFQASYSTDGVKGLLSEGGTARMQVVETLTNSLGGSIETMYYAFGADDVFVIVDLPDNESAAAAALTVSGSGAVRVKTTVLMSPAQIDEAAKMAVDYRPPGG